MTDHSKAKATSTDMFVNIIANTEKLVGTDNRWAYEDGYKHDTLDENVDNYVSAKNNLPNKKPDNIFQKCNDINTPFPKNIETQNCQTDKNITDDEILQKLDILRQLAEFRSYGVPISQNYGLNSDLKIMQCELKLHSDIKTKRNAIQWMSHMLIGCAKGIELLNDNYNPFDIKLNGLSTKINADIKDYYIVLGEIYEKYHQPGKQMAPELKLLLMLSGTILSLQAPRVLSSLLKSGMSHEINENEKVTSELRQKANASSNANVNKNDETPEEKIKNVVNQEHVKASQKASDLQLLKEKEIEAQKLRQMAEKINSNNKNFKDALLLSADSSYAQQNESVLKNPALGLTGNERNFFRAMKYSDDNKHLELARELAHSKSTQNEKNQYIETEQQKINDILKKLDNDNHSYASNDTQKSSISINPNIDKIMKNIPKNTRKTHKTLDDVDNIANKIINNDNISQSSTDKSENIINHFPSEMISVGSANKGNMPLIRLH